MMRGLLGGCLVAVAMTVACSEGLPVEEVPLDGLWNSDYRTDTTLWNWYFERHADGQTYGGSHSRGGAINWTVAIDTVWVNYPEFTIRMVTDSLGNCWPGGALDNCTLTGRFVSRTRIEMDWDFGDTHYHR